jgi:hypothetical protein
VRLGRLNAGEQLLYTFDMGDDWTHQCTVGKQRIDPQETLGIIPAKPMPYWGWGEIPDQYGRHIADDDGETPLAPDPEWRDLPPLRPDWGPRARWQLTLRALFALIDGAGEAVELASDDGELLPEAVLRAASDRAALLPFVESLTDALLAG